MKKWLAIIITIVLIIGIVIKIGQMMSIGTIGGADGPTAIFATAPLWLHYLIPVGMLVMGIVGFVRLSRSKDTES